MIMCKKVYMMIAIVMIMTIMIIMIITIPKHQATVERRTEPPPQMERQDFATTERDMETIHRLHTTTIAITKISIDVIIYSC